MSKQPAVYILASKQNGTLYIGVTSDLPKRAWEHKNDWVEGFTKKYRVIAWFIMSCMRKWRQLLKEKNR